MKTYWLKKASILGVLAAGALTLQAAEESKLKVGDKAPKLQSGKWVQGDPVTEFKNGTAYIVEFWATWCGPCRATIPHLNTLHSKFKDKGLVVIGQDVWEKDESKVVPFVKQMGEKMTYRVALDDKSSEEKGAMAVNWMEAAGQNGIPAAFIVNKEGVVAWIGHPGTLKEKTLEQVLDGSYDIKKASAEAAEAAKLEGVFTKHQRAFMSAMRDKDWDGAEAAVKEIEKLSKESEGMPSLRAQIAFGRKDYKAASKYFEAMADKDTDNAMMQNQLAWMLLTRKDIPDEDRDIKLALKLAQRGVKASNAKDANILDTLARAQYMSGQKEDAIATQEKALELCDPENKKQFQKTLDSYKAGKLPAAE